MDERYAISTTTSLSFVAVVNRSDTEDYMQIKSYDMAIKSERMKVGIAYGLLTAMIFWIPDIILHAYNGKSFSGREILILTVSLPIIVPSCYHLFRKVRGFKDDHSLTIISSIAGIWIAGPLFMTIGASFSGGGFSTIDGFFSQLSFIITCTALFPICTFMMSTYDGTLGALLITSALLPIIGLANTQSETS